MDWIVATAQLLLGLSFLVGLHEMGHMLPAKWFGMRVDKFFIGFPPKLFSKKYGDTEYGIGAIPLGGFVKIAGMVDESLDVNTLKSDPKPWEFRAKPAYQRLIVMIGGVTVNLFTGIAIFIIITYTVGEQYLSLEDAKYGIVAHDLARQIGLKTGDKIIAVNGKIPTKFSDLYTADLLLGDKAYYEIKRKDSTLRVGIPSNFMDKLTENPNKMLFIEPAFPFHVGKVIDGTPAARAGLQANDKILQVDTTKVLLFHQLQAVLRDKKGQSVQLYVLRNTDTLLLHSTVSEDSKLGFQAVSELKESTIKYDLVTSIQVGTVKAFSVVVVQVMAFKKMFSGEMDMRKSLSGPIGIAKEFGGTWDWLRFWSLTGLLSMVLAFMNLLPIPALDGGHVIFLLVEMVTSKKPSEQFLEVAQRIGMVLLLGLTAMAIFNDILRLF